MPVNSLIPLSFRPTADLMGPRDIISLQDFAQRARLREQEQQEKVKVQAALTQPGGVDPNGAPSLKSIGAITQINPELGLKLGQMREQLTLRDLQINEKKRTAGLRIEQAYVEAFDRHLKTTGGNRQEAARLAQADRMAAIDEFEKSGAAAQMGFGESELVRARQNMRDPDQTRAILASQGLKTGMTAYEQARIGQEERRTKVQEDREKRQSTGDVGGSPGGAGGQMMQDPSTGQKYMVNSKTGKAWELDEEGQWKAINPKNLPKNIGKVGNIGTAGARENVFTQRLVQAGNQASKDLENVVKLPISADRGPYGAFGSVTAPSFLDAGKVVLANKMTTEEQQVYNAMSTGFQRTLAAIESAGLMPSGSLTHQMDAVIFKPGDTNLTKLHKLAQTRQIVESGMEVVEANPRISDSEKAKVREIVQRLQKAVPFTHSDLIDLSRAQQTNPQITMREIMRLKELQRKRDGANP